MVKKPTYEELEKRINELEQAAITHKQTEMHLNLFNKVVDSATDAIGISTSEGRHWYQNNTFDSLFGEIGDDPHRHQYGIRAVGFHAPDTHCRAVLLRHCR